MSGGERTGAKNAPDAREMIRAAGVSAGRVQALEAAMAACRVLHEEAMAASLAYMDLPWWKKVISGEREYRRATLLFERNKGARDVVKALMRAPRAADGSPAALPSAGKDGEQ